MKCTQWCAAPIEMEWHFPCPYPSKQTHEKKRRKKNKRNVNCWMEKFLGSLRVHSGSTNCNVSSSECKENANNFDGHHGIAMMQITIEFICGKHAQCTLHTAYCVHIYLYNIHARASDARTLCSFAAIIMLSITQKRRRMKKNTAE